MNLGHQDYAQEMQKLLQDYETGNLNPQLLERVIHKIARQHARREANRNNCWMIGALVAMVLLQLMGAKLPSQSPINLATASTQEELSSPKSTPIASANFKKSAPFPQQSSLSLTTHSFSQQQNSPLITKPNFLPLEIHTPFLIDNSPSGAWDFTLKRNHNYQVEVPSPCTGIIRRVYFQGKTGNLKTGKGGGQIVEINCTQDKINGKPYSWVLAHLQLNPPIQEGQKVIQGESIGIQGITGRTSGYHVHAQLHYQKSWQRITSRQITRPLLEKYFTLLRTGGEAL